MNPDEKRERLRQFELTCREHGMALTVQRRHILECTLGRTDHPTADQIYDLARRRLPNVSRATVYRVLDTFVSMGVLTKASSPGAATRFDPMIRRHHHLYCTQCDRLVDIEDKQLDQAVKLPSGKTHEFQIEGFSVHFHGVCPTCQKKLKTKSSRSKTSKLKSAPRGAKRASANRPSRRNSQKKKRRETR